MTDFYEGLDKHMFQLRNAYLTQWLRGQYEQAAQVLFVMNVAMSETAVEDMPEFSFIKKGNRGKAIDQAYTYCRKWWPLVESKIGTTRTQNLEQFRNVL